MIYLIERATSLGLFQDFLKHAAGPYDPSLRYKGPEDIAVKQQKWLELVSTSQFKPGPRIERALRFVPRYIDLGSADRVIDNFRTYKDETLERWTTIDMAALDVIRQGKSVTVSSILSYIESLPEWKDKLVRTEFAPEHVERTLQGLRAMGFLKGEGEVSV
jgi:type I restriction enzyme S subunit